MLPSLHQLPRLFYNASGQLCSPACLWAQPRVPIIPLTPCTPVGPLHVCACMRLWVPPFLLITLILPGTALVYQPIISIPSGGRGFGRRKSWQALELSFAVGSAPAPPPPGEARAPWGLGWQLLLPWGHSRCL